jgi:hypothetical protein
MVLSLTSATAQGSVTVPARLLSVSVEAQVVDAILSTEYLQVFNQRRLQLLFIGS